MAEYTPQFQLKKPASDDMYDIEDFNGNMDILEAQLSLLSSGSGEVEEKIGNTDDTGASSTEGSVMGKLNAIIKNGIASVKSIQKGTVSASGGMTSKSIVIAPVNPEKCVVLVQTQTEFTGAGSSGLYFMVHSIPTLLEERTLTLSGAVGYRGLTYSASDTFGIEYGVILWQIIEFY